MALFKKESAEPSYLSNEQEFVKSASYQQRKSFVESNKDRFGKWNYTGSTAQNEKFRNKLLSEEDLKMKYDLEIRGVRQETRNNLGKLREQNNGRVENKKMRSLFGSEKDDETIILSKGGKAEYGINTTLCAKTTRENAKKLFGINVPQLGNAGSVVKEMDKNYPRISLSNDRNTNNMAEVAYVSLNVVGPNGKPISHVALATKPRGSTNWFINDPYQSGQSWIRLSDYPASVQGAWKLQAQKDNLTLGKNKEEIKVRKYKAADGGTEFETTSPKIEYGKSINANNIFLALGDRDLSGTMGDDTRRKKFLGLIPYGQKEDTSISSEHAISLELQNIAQLPKTNVNAFIAQCIRVGGGGNYSFQNRQEVISAFFGNGYNKDLHQKFMKGFSLLQLSGYIRDLKTNDTLSDTKISALEKVRPGYAKMIEGQLNQVDRNNPLYSYIQANKKQLSQSLGAQFGAFLDANSGKIGASAGAGVDLHKNIKIVAGMANGQPGVGIMIHGQQRFNGGQLDGAIGAWNAVPFASAGISVNNAEKVKGNLSDYTQSVKSIGVRGMITPLGGGGEVYFERDKLRGIEEKVGYLEQVLKTGDTSQLPRDIALQIEELYNTLGQTGYNKAIRAVVQMYKAKLAEKNEGLYLSGAGVGMAYLAGLPAIIGHIKASYLSNKYVPDKEALSQVYTDFITGRGVNKISTRAAGTGAINEQARESLYGQRPFVAQGLIMGGRNTMKITPRGGPAINVLAAQGFRENIQYMPDGTLYIQQMPGYPLPTITLRTVKVGANVRHYLIVGSTNASGSSRVLPGQNQDSRVYNDGSKTVPKTLNFPFYHGIDTVPNNAQPSQIDAVIGVALRREEKVRRIKPEEPHEPNPENPEEPGNPNNPNPEEPGNPNNPNPEEPGNPGGNPEEPGETSGQTSQPGGSEPTTEIPQTGGNDLPTSVQPESPTTPVIPGHTSTPDTSGVGPGTGNPLGL